MTTSHVIITALAGLFDKHLPSHLSEGHRCFVKVVPADSTFRSLPIVSPRQFNNFINDLITTPLVQNAGYGAGRTLKQMDHVFKDCSNEQEEAMRREIEAELLKGRVEVPSGLTRGGSVR
ncbi:hypothetical protein D8B26_002108 [Coccidioides posadasii str. Silveira]|nr:hypothetical protein D8B26_002108 [Coccidioides posadasii str. Silveira]